MLNDFKAFLLRGNVVDLAVAVVVGAAFGGVVKALIDDIIMPIIAAIIGKPDFSGLTFTINNSVFMYGSFINAVILFVSVAAAVFFFVVMPVNKLNARYAKEPPPDPSIRKCPECLSDIPAEAKRCAFCSATSDPVPQPAT
jgi:large conductance mechanosensitive channel